MRSAPPTTRKPADAAPPHGRNHGSQAHQHLRRGLTLIEAIAMVTIMAIAVPTMMWSMANAHENRVAPLMASRARFLAAERLEQVIADRFAPLRGYTFIVASNYPAESAVSGFANFGRSVAINETGASLTGTGLGYKSVTATVTWVTRKGTRSTVLSTVVTDF